MNNEHEEQTRWLINYLEARFSRVDDKVAALSGTFDARFSRVEDHISETSKELEDRFVSLLEKQQAEIDLLSAELETTETKLLKLSSQAGFLKNLLAFVGKTLLSLGGWAISQFLPIFNK